MKRAFVFLHAGLAILALFAEVHAQHGKATKGVRNVRLVNHKAVVQRNIRVHPNPSMQQWELSIATHPADPNIVLIASTASDTGGITRKRAGWYLTTDGGATWSGRDTLPTHDNLENSMYDQTAGIDVDGTLNVLTGWGIFTPPPGVGYARLSRSTDNGTTWSQTTYANSDDVEKPHMVIDVNVTSSFKNRVYTAYSNLAVNPWTIKSSRLSRGVHELTAQISGPVVGNRFTAGVNLAVDADGVLYAVWSAYSFSGGSVLGFNKSTDGGVTWGIADTIFRPVNYEGSSKGLLYRNYPSMAIDRSSGPRRGWIYIGFAERNPTFPNIFMIRSTDHGSTWSSTIKVNKDNSQKDHFMPWMSVDPSNGNLLVVYYDSRNFPANDSAEVYLSVSTDGGETFADVLVSDVPFKPTGVRQPSGYPTNYMGSYIGVCALNGIVYVCWMDNRTGFHQAYASRIELLPTSVRQMPSQVPTFFTLEQNFPNPFNPSTEIQFSLPQKTYVTLTIFDLLGREIKTLVSEELSAGSYSTRWDASGMPSGVYLYRLQAGEFVETKKLLLLR